MPVVKHEGCKPSGYKQAPLKMGVVGKLDSDMDND